MNTEGIQQTKSPPKLTTIRFSEILWGSVFKAFGLTLAILILGGLGLQMTQEIWKDMIPAAPFPNPASEEASPAAPSEPDRLGQFFSDHNFAITYGLVYVGLVLFQFARYSTSPRERRLIRRLRRMIRKVSEHWFEITFGNAIGAMIGAVMLSVAQQFSPVQICVHVVLGWLHPVIYGIAELFFNPRQIATIQGLTHWYDANQLKFAFWTLYVSAVLDDLGLPNLKTIARHCWNWIMARQRQAPQLSEKPAAPQ